MIKKLNKLNLILKKNEKSSYWKPQFWNPFSPTSYLRTHCFYGTHGNKSNGNGAPVAQRIRACSYEPWCQWFTRNHQPKRTLLFLCVVGGKSWSGKYRAIEIGSFVKVEWRYYCREGKMCIGCYVGVELFLLYPITLPLLSLGKIVDQIQILFSISSISKQRYIPRH